MKKINKIFISLGVFLIFLYRFIIRPFFPSSCKFHPTCSEYTLQAIKKYGLTRGIFKGLKRVSRCHGGNSGGFDPLL